MSETLKACAHVPVCYVERDALEITPGIFEVRISWDLFKEREWRCRKCGGEMHARWFKRDTGESDDTSA